MSAVSGLIAPEVKCTLTRSLLTTSPVAPFLRFDHTTALCTRASYFIMLRLPGVHFRFVVIVFVLQLSFQIEAYQFAPSCKHYANGDKDLTHGLRDSMGEANSMATLALNSITEDEQFNDARKMLWKGAGPADFSESHGKRPHLLLVSNAVSQQNACAAQRTSLNRVGLLHSHRHDLWRRKCL
jgi:hypothetical protein